MAGTKQLYFGLVKSAVLVFKSLTPRELPKILEVAQALTRY